jgi:hypothetical protein
MTTGSSTACQPSALYTLPGFGLGQCGNGDL